MNNPGESEPRSEDFDPEMELTTTTSGTTRPSAVRDLDVVTAEVERLHVLLGQWLPSDCEPAGRPADVPGRSGLSIRCRVEARPRHRLSHPVARG
jgi:hypothetical protein